MIVSVASGKGGTGKTTIAVNLALSLGKVQLLDCDVEEPNAHLFLKPEIKQKKKVFLKIPKIDKKLCNYCGKCSRFCQYNAIAVMKDMAMIFPELCHSCGGCSLICPQKAIKEVNREIGVVEVGRVDKIDFVQGRLNIGEAMATPLVKAVKEEIKEKDAIIDCPPGATCPVIESVRDSDYCILVAEPTPFGLHDFKIAVEILEKMRIPHGAVINRDGIGDVKIYEYCERKKIPILLKIPDDRYIAELYSMGVPFTKEMKEYEQMFRDMFMELKEGME